MILIYIVIVKSVGETLETWIGNDRHVCGRWSRHALMDVPKVCSGPIQMWWSCGCLFWLREQAKVYKPPKSGFWGTRKCLVDNEAYIIYEMDDFGTPRTLRKPTKWILLFYLFGACYKIGISTIGSWDSYRFLVMFLWVNLVTHRYCLWHYSQQPVLCGNNSPSWYPYVHGA